VLRDKRNTETKEFIMRRFSIRMAVVIGSALTALGLSGEAVAAAAPAAPLPAASASASADDSGSGASATHTKTNGSNQIRTEPRNRRPAADATRVYGPYVSPEQVRLVAD
jgi:hypothetical protein